MRPTIGWKKRRMVTQAWNMFIDTSRCTQITFLFRCQTNNFSFHLQFLDIFISRYQPHFSLSLLSMTLQILLLTIFLKKKFVHLNFSVNFFFWLKTGNNSLWIWYTLYIFQRRISLNNHSFIQRQFIQTFWSKFLKLCFLYSKKQKIRRKK